MDLQDPVAGAAQVVDRVATSRPAIIAVANKKIICHNRRRTRNIHDAVEKQPYIINKPVWFF